MKQITFSDEELQALVNLMDAGLRQLGLSAAQNAAVLLQKIQQAEDVDDGGD